MLLDPYNAKFLAVLPKILDYHLRLDLINNI
jgi:hypothetical protein